MPAVVSGVPVEGLTRAADPGQLVRRNCWPWRLPACPVRLRRCRLGRGGIRRLERLIRGGVGRMVQHRLAVHRLARVRLYLEDCVAHGRYSALGYTTGTSAVRHASTVITSQKAPRSHVQLRVRRVGCRGPGGIVASKVLLAA